MCTAITSLYSAIFVINNNLNKLLINQKTAFQRFFLWWTLRDLSRCPDLVGNRDPDAHKIVSAPSGNP